MERKRWTQQEEETLIRLYEDPKVFPKDIAKMLGRTLPQVYNKARAIGLKAPMERIRMAGKIGMLNQIKIKQLHFAWDRYQDKDIILPKFKMWKEYAKHTRDKDTIVYTIVNYDTTLEQDLERIYTLRELGLWAYVMIYDKEHCDPIYKQLSRWVNNRFVFAKCERFEDYTQKKTETENDPTLWD